MDYLFIFYPGLYATNVFVAPPFNLACHIEREAAALTVKTLPLENREPAKSSEDMSSGIVRAHIASVLDDEDYSLHTSRMRLAIENQPNKFSSYRSDSNYSNHVIVQTPPFP